jgi:hypothetical protein
LATAKSTIDAVANRCFLYRGRNAELIGNPSIVHVAEKQNGWHKRLTAERDTKLFSREDSDSKTLGKGSSYLDFRKVRICSQRRNESTGCDKEIELDGKNDSVSGAQTAPGLQ